MFKLREKPEAVNLRKIDNTICKCKSTKRFTETKLLIKQNWTDKFKKPSPSLMSYHLFSRQQVFII